MVDSIESADKDKIVDFIMTYDEKHDLPVYEIESETFIKILCKYKHNKN